MPNNVTFQRHSSPNALVEAQKTTESDRDSVKSLQEAERISSAIHQISSFDRIPPSGTGPMSEADHPVHDRKLSPPAAVSSSVPSLNTRSTDSVPLMSSELALQGAEGMPNEGGDVRTMPASAAALRAMRQRQPLNDYRSSLGAAVEAKDWADGLEDNALLGSVFSPGFPPNRFDLQIELIDAMISTAFSFGQVLRDFSNPDVCKQYMERNNEAGDTSIREQIEGAEQNCRYFAEEAHHHVSKAAGAILAVQAEPSLLHLRSNAEALGQALPSNIEEQLSAHQEALRWPFMSQLEPTGLTRIIDSENCTKEAVMAAITGWQNALHREIEALVADIEGYRAIARSNAGLSN